MHGNCNAEMELQQDDTWGHFAPMFHLVDAFAIYAITLVGGRHAVLPAYTAQQALLSIGGFPELVNSPIPVQSAILNLIIQVHSKLFWFRCVIC